MEKYNKALFQQLLRGELSTEQIKQLTQDPAFDEEFQFYLTFREAGQQLKKKYLEDSTLVESEVIPLSQERPWWGIAAAIVPLLIGGYVVYEAFPDDTLLGNESSIVENVSFWIGAVLMLVGAALGLYFWKKKP